MLCDVMCCKKKETCGNKEVMRRKTVSLAVISCNCKVYFKATKDSRKILKLSGFPV